MTSPRPRTLPRLRALEDRTAPAGLDPAFGDGGVAVLPHDPFSDLGYVSQLADLAPLPDGRTLFTGGYGPPPYEGGALAVGRLTADGRLDPTFGGGDGAVRLTGRASRSGEVVALPDGRILVAFAEHDEADSGGASFLLPPDQRTGRLVVIRLTADGRPDPTFGDNGEWSLPRTVGSPTVPYYVDALAADADGRPVVVGPVGGGLHPPTVVLRLTADGRPDPAFGDGGFRVIPPPPPPGASVGQVAAFPDGRVMLAGSTVERLDNGRGLVRVWAVRLTADGQLDATFDGDGQRVVEFPGGDASASDIAVLPDGRAVLAGAVTVTDDPAHTVGRSAFAAVRLTAGGGLDPTYGDGGWAVADRTWEGLASDVTGRLLPDGSVQFGGLLASPDGAFVLGGRLRPDGTTDRRYGRDGAFGARLAADSASFWFPIESSAAVLPDGRVVAAVARTSGTDYTPRFARLAAEPGRDSDYRFRTPSGRPGAVRGDVDGDGTADRVLTEGALVRVVSGATGADLTTAFAPYEAQFTGPLRVTTDDLDGDGKAEVVVTPGAGGGPVVAVYSGARLAAGLTGEDALLVRFFGIADPTFRGGAVTALGDVNGNGVPDLTVSAGAGGGPRVTIWAGDQLAVGTVTAVADFFAFDPALRTGATVAAGDLDADGGADLAIAGGPADGGRVRVVSGPRVLARAGFTALDEVIDGTRIAEVAGGPRVGVSDLDGDGADELLVEDPATTRVRVFTPATLGADPVDPAPDRDLEPGDPALHGAELD